MRKYFIVACLISLFSFSGCQLFEVFTDKEGKQTTQIETTLTTASGAIKDAGDLANNFFPGAKLISGGIAALLGLIGTSITSVVVARKNSSVASTVIQGAEVAAENYDKLKETILSIFTDEKVKSEIENIFKQNMPIKNLIASIASSVNNSYEILDKKVQKVIPKFNKQRKNLTKKALLLNS